MYSCYGDLYVYVWLLWLSIYMVAMVIYMYDCYGYLYEYMVAMYIFMYSCYGYLYVWLLWLQVLGRPEEPGGVPASLDALHHLPALPALPLHPHLRTSWHAALRRRVSSYHVIMYVCMESYISVFSKHWERLVTLVTEHTVRRKHLLTVVNALLRLLYTFKCLLQMGHSVNLFTWRTVFG